MKVDAGVDGLVDLVSRRSRKDPPDKGGWNAFLTSSASVDIVDPLVNTYINMIGDNAWFGWPKDEVLVKMRAEFDEAVPVGQRVVTALPPGVEAHTVGSIDVVIAEQRVLPAAEGSKGHWHRDRHVDTHHADLQPRAGTWRAGLAVRQVKIAVPFGEDDCR